MDASMSRYVVLGLELALALAACVTLANMYNSQS